MPEQDELDHRESLLAFLEAHWGNLTLREARSLSPEGIRTSGGWEAALLVKDALMSP
jgi:hypothetical protein